MTGSYDENIQLYVSFGFGLKESLSTGSISVNPVGKVNQVAVDPIVIRSAQLHTEHASFSLAPDLDAPRNLAIAVFLNNSPTFQATNKLSNEERVAAKDAQCPKLADILFEHRHSAPKKPIVMTHLRDHQWYIDLFELTAPMNYAKADLVFDLFKKKLNEFGGAR